MKLERALACTLGWLCCSGVGMAQPACDRACLEGFVDQYMDALIAHDPSKLATARNLKMTENGVRLEPGDGFWRTATAKGAYRLFVADPQTGQVAFFGTMKEAGIPVSVAIRLKIANRLIAEIETFVVRTGIQNTNGANELEKLGHPRAALAEAVPTGERASREELIKIANLYFSGRENPFAEDCARLEDGLPPRPPPSCKAAFESGYYHFVNRIRDRRFLAVDMERGLVFSFVYLDSAGPKRPWTWETAEVFKIRGGKIHQVEALLEQVPYAMLSGWSSWEDGMSSRAR